MTRVALLFDNTLRPETTGVYCRRAVGELVQAGRIAEVEHFLPTDLPRLRQERQRWDLLIAIDDGLDYDLSEGLPPVAWWAIDTHLDFARCLRRAQQAQWTFSAQRNGAERLRQQGINAEWLPLACDAELHGRQNVSPEYDWSFVGNVFPGERARLMELLQEKHPDFFVGQQYFKEMAAVYSASKLVFNRSIGDDVNMRVWEGLCSGSLLITNDLIQNGLGELFQDGLHLATYQSDCELLQKVDFYLSNDAQRERVAAAGRAEVLARHTYRHRMERILDVVSSSTVSGSEIGSKRSRPLPTKVNDYFEFDRPDVQELVPMSAKQILDIGCGAGRLGAALKARQSAHVTGIELNPQVALAAQTRLDDVRIANLETDQLSFVEGSFDCVICADILEHLRQPEIVLTKIRKWLSPDGALVVSVPNVRNHTVVQSLLAGNWTYESAGLLDADHVRFFTRRELEKLLFRAGFEVEELRMVPGDGFQTWVDEGRPREISLGGLQIQVPTSADAAEFFAYQYLVRAVPQGVRAASQRPDPSHGLQRLAQQFPWPAERPSVTIPQDHLGWFEDGARDLLQREVARGTRLIIELGSWLGLSTRFLADRAPDAKIVAIDHWEGSPEHRQKPQWQAMLPTLYESFLSLSWDYRDRIQPLRRSTRDGLRTIAAAGLDPELIFVDADHTYESVLADLADCRTLFPNAVLTGDDYDAPGVRRAVEETAAAHSLQIETYGQRWRAWKLVDPRQGPRVQTITLAPADSFGLTSIIVVTWNQLAYTRACLDSLRLRTDERYELIVVDNGSTDGTVEWLRAQPDVQLIVNAHNLGFPAAVNQALSVAQGEQVLLLNNDTILTTGWLRRMLDVLHSDPTIGLVGPTSNCVGSEQQIPVDYSQLNDLDGFAWDRRRQLVELGEPVVQETDRLIGFCLLFKREVLDAIGFLDERFGIGCFEDDDFCRRAHQAGYRSVIARDSFIHHFGSVTFRASGANLGQILRDNREIYDQKWQTEESRAETQRRGEDSGAKETARDEEKSADETRVKPPPASAKSRPEFVLVQDDDGNLILEPNRIRLSGCLIVRNNETTIRPCLESLKPWVDELIVVDTGSTDATPRIAGELGARVFHWPWRDDFAAARNVSLGHARGEWLFWMDSDDVIPEECGRKLRELADGEHDDEQLLGYVVQVHCPGDDPSDVTVVDHVKLFRNLPELRFEFRIHEQILPAIRRAGGDVAFTEIYVVHAGSDRTKDGQARKLERDFKLLNLELADRPDHPFVLFNLGMTHADCGQFALGIRCLERCLQVSGPDESHVRKAYALLISSLMQSDRFDDAEVACRQGQKAFPEDKELLFRQAMLAHHFGRLDDAVAAYRQLLEAPEDRHFTSIDAGLAGYKARHNLALVYEDLGDFARAAQEWQRITTAQPDYVPAWRGLIDAWLRLGRTLDVVQLCTDLAENSNSVLRNLVPYCRGRLCETHGELEEALAAFELADHLEPRETTSLRHSCRLLFESGRWSRARDSLEQLASRVPDDASVFHNLGLARWQTGDLPAARQDWHRSLQLRPDYRETLELLHQTSRTGDWR